MLPITQAEVASREIGNSSLIHSATTFGTVAFGVSAISLFGGAFKLALSKQKEKSWFNLFKSSFKYGFQFECYAGVSDFVEISIVTLRGDAKFYDKIIGGWICYSSGELKSTLKGVKTGALMLASFVLVDEWTKIFPFALIERV
ncbi:MAG: hypothetical protein Ta2E_12680 [Mycoplasmoidaceae bacterium]|nr:MAG: hypothetical protein Ta2E_12680 [Mycoplasmoidaceae bacterium]